MRIFFKKFSLYLFINLLNPTNVDSKPDSVEFDKLSVEEKNKILNSIVQIGLLLNEKKKQKPIKKQNANLQYLEELRGRAIGKRIKRSQ